MDFQALLKLSPTLLGRMQQKTAAQADKAMQVWRNPSKDQAKLLISVDIDGVKTTLLCDEFPKEFQQALHDYATRLIAEKLLIDEAMEEICTRGQVV